MDRHHYLKLLDWKQSIDRKPLIIQGARQVGKTFLILQFANQEYKDFVYCNFEEDPDLISMFDGKLTASTLIEQLSFYANKKIIPHETLIIFDEIQLAPRALTSLKYFNEQANQYHVIAAGSLLGVSIGQSSAFPVGKVNFLELYPLNFIEFLTAIDEAMLADMLTDKNDLIALNEAIHNKLSRLFDIFLFIGGMPEVVQNYCKQRDIQKVQAIQRNIHSAYANDFSKYAEPHESLKISNLWQTIPFQLAKENKKFLFSSIQKGARHASYELAIEWLRKAGLIYLSYNIKTAELPIKTYIESNIFKLYYLDTGLLGSRLNIKPQLIPLRESLYTEYKGALIENYVAKEIKPIFDEYLYYWTSKSRAEVDFIIELDNIILPIEVKSGYTKHKKSLISFQQKYNAERIIRISPRNFTQDGSFINIPLYATCVLKSLLSRRGKRANLDN